jgi:hypothetical protein
MAASIPDPLKLRDIKYGAKSTPAERTATARRFLDAGRLAEALELYLLAEDADGIAAVRRRAVDEGRVALLNMLRRAGREIGPDDWRRGGDAALRAGRPREADRCFLEIGDEAGLARVRVVLPDYEIFTPQGK